MELIWPDVVRQIGGMLAGDLEKAELPAIFGPNQLVIRFPNDYNRQYAACSDPNRLQRIQDGVRRATGQDWTVRCELRVDVPAPDQAQAAAPQPVEHVVEPLLDKIMLGLNAKLLKIDDGFGREKAQPVATDADDAWDGREEV